MATRNHELKFGERVFDCDMMAFGTFVGTIIDGTAKVVLTDADIALNTEFMGAEDYEDFINAINDKSYWFTDENSLYQFAEDKVGRDNNPVCYEHNDTEDEYPYYSPYLNENLFNFEVFTA